MRKIEVLNTSIRINDYEFGDCEKLENYFRVFEPTTHSYYYLGIFYDKINKCLYLPRGIDIWLVERLLGEDADVKVNSYYKYQSFEDIYIKLLPRDDVQKAALRFMLGKEEYRKTATDSQLSVNLSTGKGKTYITIATLAYMRIRGIVITNSVEWLRQWADRTLEYTNIKNTEIFTISGSANVTKLLNMTDKQLSKYKLFLVTHDTLQSYASKYGWDSIGEFMEKIKIGVKIYDEAHLNFTNMCMIDFHTNVYKTYYLTATPVKSAEKENQIYQLAFKNIPSIELFDTENDPHTDYIAITFNSRPTPVQISNCKNMYGLDRNKYTNYVVHQENFHKIIVVVMDMALKATRERGKKCLIYIGTNKAIESVKDIILDVFPILANDIGIYTSIVSKEDKKIALSKRIILSTTKSAGAAVDIAGLKLTVVLAEPFKSEVIARQTLGRTRDNNTMYIDLVDKGFVQCVRYYYKKLPVFNKYAKSCSIVALSDKDLDDRFESVLESLMPKKMVPLMTKIEK